MLYLHLIIGKSLSGKSTLCDQLEKRDIPQIITTTTRPKREHEINGRDYHFTNLGQALNDIENDQAIAPRKYHVANGETWYYYLSYKELKRLSSKSQHHNLQRTLILDGQGFIDLINYLKVHTELDVKIIPWYLNVDLYTRLKRYVDGQRQHEDPREVVRRLYMDEFHDFKMMDDPKFIKSHHVNQIQNLNDMLKQLPNVIKN